MLDKYIVTPRVFDSNQPTAIAIEETAADLYVHTFMQAAILHRVLVLITVATNEMATTSAVVSFDYRPTFASDVGRTEIDTVIIPDHATAGSIYYADCKQKFLPGEQLVIEMKTPGHGGTETGDFRPFVEVEYIPEVPGNCPNMTESA